MSDQGVRFEPRMTDAEALMWALEHEPMLRSSFANVTVLDQPIDHCRFRRRISEVVDAVPRLRQRVVARGPLPGAPRWEDDRAFDLDFHVRRLALAAPGADHQLHELAALLAQDPFDLARPLWQFVLVEGLERGRGAMIQRLHHTLTDGQGGIRLSALFLDLERDPPPAGSASAPRERAAPRSGPWARQLAPEALRRPLELAAAAFGGALEAAISPTRAVRALETARSLLRQVALTEPARSPLWRARGLRRRLEVLSVPMEEAKAAAGALGGTVNDLFVTAAAGAAGHYHRVHGVDIGDLRMAMPLSTRTDGRSGANAFAPTRVLVPAGEPDPARRFALVRERLTAVKSEAALTLAEPMLGLAAFLPLPALGALARQQVHTVDFATSNVRGAPFDLYLGGALVVANYPMGPVAGTAFNLTMLSYRGTLDMGCHIDADAVADPPLLRRSLQQAFSELLSLA